MKTIKSLAACFLAISMLFIQPSAAQADETTYNPAAEEYILSELLADGEADLALAFPDASQRVVRGEFIVELLKNPSLQQSPFIKIYNTTIEGDIRGDGLNVPFTITFDKCRFTGRIEFSSAKIRSFLMYNSLVEGSVRFNRATISDDLSLYESTYEKVVSLFGANIGGNFYGVNSQFLGTEPDPDTAFPFEIWTTRIAKDANLYNARLAGIAMVESANIGGNLNLSQATFENRGSFKDVRIGNFLIAQSANFKDEISFESGIVGRDTEFSGSNFNGDANFQYFASSRFINFTGANFSKGLNFQYTEAGWMNFQSTTFNGQINFTGVQIENDLDFTGTNYMYTEEPLTFNSISVAGTGLFVGISAPAGLRLTYDDFGDVVISGTDQPFAIIDVSASTANNLYIHDVKTDQFLAPGFVAESSTAFENFQVTSMLDMSNADIGFFSITNFAWPTDPDNFNLRSMSYADIGLGNQELEDNNWNVLLKMLEDSAYSPQAYQTMASFLIEKGHPDWAAEVEVARKTRERDSILKPRSGAWFWSWFMFIFSGYGQRPFLAFVWGGLVIIIGTIVFRKEEEMQVVDEDVVVPVYNALLYSFDLFIPYVELGISDKWDPKPERRAAWIYKHIHQLLGWVLMPIALLTFGGIIG